MSRTTPASSAVVGGDQHARVGRLRGRPATIGRRSAADSLQPQPAPWESEVRAGGIARLSCPAVPEYTDAQLDAAVEALSDPEKLEEAQRLVASTAPQLQGILNQALESADWFGSAHQAEVLRAAGVADPDERIAAVRTLIAEETRISMLIGVAVGYELAQTAQRKETERTWQWTSGSWATRPSSSQRATRTS